ncbi:flagellar regulator YcgR PilZN domain-containing protein [Halopseudomonas oceani]|uniref:flagellar brake protein n=1 Tax=Halopseudomonas oceani TaxID=1708783 RepID=UPI002AA62619|nr:flagellar regulator YcgR PilZN domain-containing protein [Halopseudomonas oceani]
MQARDTLTVTFTDRSQKFQSFIVNLDSDKGAIWIDELIPREGDRYANQGESFRIDAWHEGIHMRWNCPGASQVMLDDAPAYAIPLPAELIYHQKRGAFRASVRRTADIAVEMVHPERDRRFTCYLMDLSATGCKVRLEGDQSKSLKPGEEYPNSVLHLPDMGRVEVNVEVRHVVFREDANETHLGLMFKLQSAQAQRSIDRFVNQLQREARRLEKEDLF